MNEGPSIGRMSARHAVPEDLTLVMATYRLNFGGIVEEARGWDERVEAAYMEKEMREAPFFILFHEEAEAGFISYEKVEADGAVHLRHIEVHPSFSGRGMGTLALRWLKKRAGGKPIRVAVTEGNHRGMDFYTNLGFVPLNDIYIPVRGARRFQFLKKTMMQLD